MALSPYQFRPLTPPVADEVPALIPGSQSRTVSEASSRSARSSPEYFQESFEYNSPDTPLNRSPLLQLGGPVLIPQVRKQDLCPEPTFTLSSSAVPRSHRRSSSVSPTTNIYAPQPRAPRSQFLRATTTPPEVVNYDLHNTCNPYSYNASAADFILGPSMPVAMPSTLSRRQSRSGSSSGSSGSGPYHHHRSVSEGLLDMNHLSTSTFQSLHRSSYMSNLYIPPTIEQCDFDFSTPIDSIPDVSFDTLAEDIMLLADADELTVSQLGFLGGAGPMVQICRQQPAPMGRNKKSQYWFDVRNVAEWADFSFDTILEMPAFCDLLSVPVPQRALVEPLIPAGRTRPADHAELKALVRDYYAAKVNAALRVSQGGHRHLAMRAGQRHGGADFLSNYETPASKSVAGNESRGRVVGLVKSFDTWNTGLRSSLNPNERCRYLEGLAHLHRCLREAECRYGFIMTETELVCVRYGTGSTPLFGYLELSASIRLSESSGLTACLALWYLHMLAGDDALPGQCGYRVHVGLPGELTRQNVLEEKDDWIAKLKIAEFEKREAKQTRGWADPTEKWNRKMEGGSTRRRK